MPRKHHAAPRRASHPSSLCISLVLHARLLILPLLLPQSGSGRQRIARRVAGVAASPLLLALAAVANLSLRRDGGDDCLGYTALAVRPEA